MDDEEGNLHVKGLGERVVLVVCCGVEDDDREGRHRKQRSKASKVV